MLGCGNVRRSQRCPDFWASRPAYELSLRITATDGA